MIKHSSDINSSQRSISSDLILFERVDHLCHLQVSTLRYIKMYFSVPVPQVYLVEDRLLNPVSGRFIIEERVSVLSFPTISH